MAITTMLPKLSDEQVAKLIDTMVHKYKLDSKLLKEDLAQSTTKVKELEPSLMAIEQQFEFPEIGERIQQITPVQPSGLTSTFARLAREALNLIHVHVHRPSILETEHFNSGEWSVTEVDVRNPSDLPIRDVVVTLRAMGPVIVVRQIGPLTYNPRYISKLQPGESRTLQFFVRAKSVADIENARLCANLAAEVVPFVSHAPRFSPEFEVWPND